MQHRALLYDKGGDQHYDTISALHKALRGSDPDAGLYWLARMLEAGEDPLYIVRRLIRQVAPSFLWITMHDIDVAHAGAYSLYIEGIRRTDRLCGELWKLLQNEPEYSGKTTLLVLPDFGRDADDDAGGNGFQHHRTGGPLARTTWLLALGPRLKQNVTVDRPIESIDLVPTVGGLLGFDTSKIWTPSNCPGSVGSGERSPAHDRSVIG